MLLALWSGFGTFWCASTMGFQAFFSKHCNVFFGCPTSVWDFFACICHVHLVGFWVSFVVSKVLLGLLRHFHGIYKLF